MEENTLYPSSLVEGLSAGMDPLYLWPAFAIFGAFYLVLSIVLIYHWRRFGYKAKGVIFSESLYITVSVILFMLALSALVIYQINY